MNEGRREQGMYVLQFDMVRCINCVTRSEIGIFPKVSSKKYEHLRETSVIFTLVTFMTSQT